MAAHVVDMAGLRYSSVTAISRAGENSCRASLWKFLCDCGDEFIASGNEVRRGNIKRCPACAAQLKHKAVTTHGLSKSSEYAIWTAMKARCHREGTKQYEDYGGRGIVVCERWRQSFECFLADMGPRPKGMTLDRKANNGNYEPGNCRWATRKEQNCNKRTNRNITIDGTTKTIAEWAEQCEVTEGAIRRRLKRGLTGSELLVPAFKTNLRKRKSA